MIITPSVYAINPFAPVWQAYNSQNLELAQHILIVEVPSQIKDDVEQFIHFHLVSIFLAEKQKENESLPEKRMSLEEKIKRHNRSIHQAAALGYGLLEH